MHIYKGHVSPEHFLDLLEAEGYTCDVDHVRYGYAMKIVKEEEVVLPAPPGEPVTYTCRGTKLRGEEEDV